VALLIGSYGSEPLSIIIMGTKHSDQHHGRDGHQVNTGGGRASRAHGYVMEVSTGRWVAGVRNLGSDLLPFGAAKKEAIRLY